jgi:hypothetical protein
LAVRQDKHNQRFEPTTHTKEDKAMPASSLDTLLRFGAGPLVDHGADVPPATETRVAKISGLRLALLIAQKQLPKRSPLLSQYSALYKQAQDIYTRWADISFREKNAAGLLGTVAAPTSANEDRNWRRSSKRRIAC